MLDKLKQLHQMKQQMDEAKARMDAISVKGECDGVTVVSNGNRRIVSVSIPPHLLANGGTEAVNRAVMAATNDALSRAEAVFESEMRGMAGGLMGGLL